MSDHTTTSDPRPHAAPPGNLAVPDDLLIADWIESSNLDLELEDHDSLLSGGEPQTVADVRQAFNEVYLAECDCEDYPLAIFVGADGRAYAAEIDVVIRPATPEEVEEAVEDAKETALSAATSRVEKLDGYLSAAKT